MHSHLSATHVTSVLIEDENDNVPHFTLDLFTGTVEEGLSIERFQSSSTKPDPF